MTGNDIVAGTAIKRANNTQIAQLHSRRTMMNVINWRAHVFELARRAWLRDSHDYFLFRINWLITTATPRWRHVMSSHKNFNFLRLPRNRFSRKHFIASTSNSALLRELLNFFFSINNIFLLFIYDVIWYVDSCHITFPLSCSRWKWFKGGFFMRIVWQTSLSKACHWTFSTRQQCCCVKSEFNNELCNIVCKMMEI